jgi:enoyl-[acyl-carrier protein] reductase I
MTDRPRTALVVGAATRHSIAWATAERLAADGLRLGLVYRRPESARRLAPLVEATGAAFAMACDVRDDAAIAAVAERAREAFDGRLDVLVHSVANAPAGALGGRFTDTTRADFAATLDVSAYSLVALTRAVEPLLTSVGGSVVTLTAIASRRVFEGYNVMGVAKAALEASVRHLAVELGPAGIRVNAVSAGAVRTVAAMGVPGFRATYREGERLAPLRRGITARDVAAAIAWLASPAAGAITGQTIEVDAGWSVLGLGGAPAPRESG